MKAIEVLVNGKRLCVAGSGKPEFTFVDLVLYDKQDEATATLIVAGSRAKMVPRWIDDCPIKEGDEVLVRIVDVTEADPPVDSSPSWTEFPRIKLDDGSASKPTS